MIYKRIALFLLVLLLCACSEKEERAGGGSELRVGFFPNLTHVQALVARHMSRMGQGWFEPRLTEAAGYPVHLTWYAYNAGPSAMEAIFARSLELTYVGPSPVINAWVKAAGGEVRIIAGALEGGAALVVPGEATLCSPVDFRGKTLATPQLGNTQDISCRAWLRAGGVKTTLTGGDALIMPTRNPEQLTLFAQRRLAGVWTVEPWVSRLEMQAGGRVLVNESDALTTVLAASEQFLRTRPELAAAFAAAHRELTCWILEHPDEAQQMVIEELKDLTKATFDADLLRSAWQRIHPVAELNAASLQHFVRDAHLSGLLRSEPDVGPLIHSFPIDPSARP